MTVDVSERGNGVAEVTVGLTYANDGDPVTGALVTMVASAPNRGATSPVKLMEVGLGGYQGRIELPSSGNVDHQRDL
jgi:hypothetical protein